MILVISGTKEGREITSLLISKDYKVLSATVVNHGARLILHNDMMENTREYTIREAFNKIFQINPFRLIVDASHPYPEGVSKFAKEFCSNRNIPYFRFVREEVQLPENPLLFAVYSWEEAARKAAEMGDTIFLTTGSFNLEQFLCHPDMAGKRVVVRVLPDPQVITKVRSLGLPSRDIVAMQGPFSREMNRATFKMYGASVVVTKESGRAGGTDNKVSVALKLMIPVVVIKRPPVKGHDAIIVNSYGQVLQGVKSILADDK
ncbi:precorrin-6A reductase [Phosphitispora fastidiosa]|uniref:precorrin-6A reductase n=1 Tax=Phosphitispora fastidiosa TaxID=2837202 RepID=UPI001E4C2C59|nr:precorrin-6A reductase [Phosphitispora fastidiosa]MBU7005841.1 precorrin-6A/cobalt-precorrin-6A reductase [Phosphitispora fastidiosa]